MALVKRNSSLQPQLLCSVTIASTAIISFNFSCAFPVEFNPEDASLIPFGLDSSMVGTMVKRWVDTKPLRETVQLVVNIAKDIETTTAIEFSIVDAIR